MDDGKISVVMLLDLSAAFDTTDHEILLARLQSYFDVDGTALAWLRSYQAIHWLPISDRIAYKLSCVCYTSVPFTNLHTIPYFTVYRRHT